MARVLLITNPGAARTDPDLLPAITQRLARRGLAVEVAGTTKPGDIGELARHAVAEGVELVAVYGGDGTAMRAVRGLVGSGAVLALIPGGTGNLLAGNLRIPRNPAKAADLLVTGRPRAIDLGRVERDDGVHYFAVNCGAGFDAELMAATSEQAKRRWGLGAYVAKAWQGLANLDAVPHRITIDGEPWETEAATVLIANCGELVPPFLRLKEGIAPDDGVLDVVVLSARGALEGMGVLWQLVTGLSNGAGRVAHARGRRIVIDAHPARPVQLDGEPTGSTPVEAVVLPAALRVLVPPER